MSNRINNKINGEVMSKKQEQELWEAMCRYTDPRSPEYDPKFTEEYELRYGKPTELEMRRQNEYVEWYYGLKKWN